MSETITLKVLRCNDCNDRAIPLGGYGSACRKPSCRGSYDAWDGESVRKHEMAPGASDDLPDGLIVEVDA